MSEQIVWGVTSYDLGGNSGFVVHCLFTTKEEADKYAAVLPDDYDVEEFTLYDEAPGTYTYWHRGASVYPDKTVEDWKVEHASQPPYVMAPLDDHMAPWDGHTQSHCGLHISIFGTDEQAVELAYERQLADALERSTGTCSCGRTELFMRGFMDDPLRDKERAECAKTHTEGWCPNCHVYTTTFVVSSK